MIAPDMATMLGYIFTDAAVDATFLQSLLSASNQNSFNCITVDSDTSTSDTVLAFATGKAGNAALASFNDAGADAFAAALTGCLPPTCASCGARRRRCAEVHRNRA